MLVDEFVVVHTEHGDVFGDAQAENAARFENGDGAVVEGDEKGGWLLEVGEPPAEGVEVVVFERRQPIGLTGEAASGDRGGV